MVSRAAKGEPVSVYLFATDSPLEGDGFEPSVPHKKQPFLACPRSVPQFAFRNKNRLFRAGTDGSNPSPSSEESNANLMPTTSSQPPVRHDIRGPRILAA